MGKTDVELLVGEKNEGHVGLVMIVTITTIITAASVAFTVVMFLDIQKLEQQDVTLKQNIDNLLSNLQRAQLDEVFGETLNVHGDDQIFKANAEYELQNGKYKRHGTKRSNSLFDTILKAQESVFEKYCKDHNASCPAGAHGDKGLTGDPGVPGQNGPPGKQGLKGPQGDTGIPGFKGITGDNGTRGDTGMPGKTGPRGDKGPTGPSGVTGLSGYDGSPGPMGDTGLKGQVGDQGLQGPPGYPGIDGPKGEPGDPGQIGTQGDLGVVGPKGPDVKKFADDCQCLKKPSFRSVDTHSERNEGGVYELPCHATGNPQPEVTIHHQGTTVITNNEMETISSEDIINWGDYMCTATNEYGSVTKNVIHQPSF